ncbi:DNA-binding protein [Streptomyces sp. NPDC020379]|uniref:DNA-binding protein n=1 Tax=Streptomyces sp. NPDC020379 TaxID=3365071 RepID=UPI0037984E69
MTLADLAVTKQKLAAAQADPVTLAIAGRDTAGVHLNHGEFEDGLAVVDRAICQVETHAAGQGRSCALGIPRLRGMTLAGRLKDKATADRHIAESRRLARDFDHDANRLGNHFGPQNTAVHVVATSGDLGRHQDAIDEMSRFGSRNPLVLPATRTSPLHMNVARSKLALGDRTGALEELEKAWALAP